MTMKELQEQWEEGGRFVAEFKKDGAVYRIIHFESGYSLLRYFEIGGTFSTGGPVISADYQDIDAELMMFALGEIVQYGEVGGRAADVKLTTARAKRAIALEYAPEDPYDEDGGPADEG